MSAALRIVAPDGIGEIAPGDDLAARIGDAVEPLALQSGDILVVAQKIVSKAEGRAVGLDTVTASAEAIELSRRTAKDPRLVELVLRESAAVMRAKPGVLIVRHRLGLVMANAGIDQSNVMGEDQALLLPIDPDASAARLRGALMARFGCDLGVIVADSFGRAWRFGTVNVAIGAAGLATLWDRRGELDRRGRPLAVTEVAVADAIAAAAGLAMGEGNEGRPVALVQGWRADLTPGRAADLVRPADQDLFP